MIYFVPRFCDVNYLKFITWLMMIIRPKWRPSCLRPFNALHLQALTLRNLTQLRLPLDLPTTSIEGCPPSECSCAATPEDLDIDHEKPLAGTIPYYDQHVVIDTGEVSWPSRIEDSEEPNLAATLKGLIKNELYDVSTYNVFEVR